MVQQRTKRITGERPGSVIRSGKRWRKFSAAYKAKCRALGLPCFHCGQPIDYQAPSADPRSFQSDHVIPVSVRPDLVYVESNLVPSCSRCNAIRGTRPLERGQWVPANDW